MECATIKKGMNCPFMTSKGCSYNGGSCREIVEQCKGCNRVMEVSSGFYCAAFPDPSLKWKNGKCNLASHVASASASTTVKLNPLKASKRGSK
ncbi:MAG TPA: PxxKW family cysteine-rich protein [Desulfobacterales bacterium]|nr:PxxKW family cysteine-rich protein [Desulfobacterales bacterium]